MDMQNDGKRKQKIIIQEIRHGLLKASDAKVSVKQILSGNTAGELVADLFGQ